MCPGKTQRPFEHRYFTWYPVESESEASWFAKQPTFTIMDLLWKAGPRGLTATEVGASLDEQRENVTRTVVYQTLKGLYESEKVGKEWDNSVKAHRYILRERPLPGFSGRALTRPAASIAFSLPLRPYEARQPSVPC